MKKNKKTSLHLLSLAVFVAVLAMQTFMPSLVSAAQITARSLTLQADTDGGAKPSGIVKHQFSFTIPSSSSVGSIQFLYCTTAGDTCITPTGLSTVAATLTNQVGATGFTLNNTTNGAPYLTKVTPAVASGTLIYQLSNVINPSDTNKTFFVRISTFATTDATGAATDKGTVAASTATDIVLSGTMPESLVFCTGAIIGLTATVPDCATATSGLIDFNQMFSPTDTATATSQMAASTNAGSGYAITVNGPTMTSGGNTIVAMGAAGTTAHGVSQFGLNLKANTTATSTVAVGSEIAVPSNGTNYRGEAAVGYNTPDNFKFTAGDVVADSASGGAGGSDSQIFTASYIVNVPGSQPAGTYTTTLTYICTPTF